VAKNRRFSTLRCLPRHACLPYCDGTN
jgi:hypothetical protein